MLSVPLIESQELSEKSESASGSVWVFLDELSGEDAQPEFNKLATDLVTTIENSVLLSLLSKLAVPNLFRKHLR